MRKTIKRINDYIQGQEIFTLLRFYGESVKFIIGPKILVIGPFRFLCPNKCFDLFW